MRFDMLKKPATAEMSQMSRSEKPALRNAARSGSPTSHGVRELPRKIQHRARTRVEIGGAVVCDHRLGEHRVAGQLSEHRAMRDQAIVTVVRAGHDDGNHLALDLGQARLAEHQIVGHRDKGLELRKIEGISLEHVRNEAELLLAFREIGFHRLIEFGGR